MRGIAYLLALFVVVSAQDCPTCILHGDQWCPKSQKCNDALCLETIKTAYNCPRVPDTAYAYDDSFARNYVVPYLAAVYNNDPSICLKKLLPQATFYKRVHTNCSVEGPGTTCTGYTAYDVTNKLIIASFAGTDGSVQLADEFLSYLKAKVPFFNNGKIYKYFDDAFFHVWNAGMSADIQALKYRYPDYNLLVTGHSLGGSLATVFASFIVKYNMWTGNNIKLITIGQPRTGDPDFAAWHDYAFPYSYRVVHHRDPVPHIPPAFGDDPVYHHRYEVWYNNDMKVGQNYTICPEADGLFCSNAEVNYNGDDHVVYYNIDIPDWGSKGCN